MKEPVGNAIPPDTCYTCQVTKQIIILLLIPLAFLVILLIADVLIIKYSGSPVAAPNIPRKVQKFGSGSPLKFVVMGDSTSIGQGTEYEHSYAYAAAQHLSKNYQVSLLNVGVSGARTKDVADNQLPKALKQKSDIVLIAIGANDVTHLTSLSSVKSSFMRTIDGLRTDNPDVKIVITGSPAMGSVARFPWPIKQLAGLRAKQLNNDVFMPAARDDNLVFAPVAEKTGPAFRADPTLFAQDKFHPSTRGYALWFPVVNAGLDSALN